ncbi:Dipeptidyl aminopeptidase/acylaminoacyl peptidase [Evansella caseinilytica]|uniref:Dipeptidyl aminopeptidase/acylaminoacyl peptidase n=1 Tax=Evansella caseinilytica TaxID=1503961 RepID=A0A1H3KBP8_9BACI|nr:S9 family peptidase [Evansella caseinilytica]SDY49591.1 Dipeptidyl aminopeptidase/acylaminoacyl peptidase [Evansella caseinilytica]
MSTRALTVEDLRTFNVINEPQLSPDGSCFAFVKQYITDEDEYISHLYVQSTMEQESKQWTFGEGRVGFPRFSPDGRWLVYAAAKGKNAKQQLYLLSMDGGEARQITTLENGASKPIWSPDSKQILFTTAYKVNEAPDLEKKPNDQPEEKKPEPLVVEKLVYKSDAAGFLDGKRQQLAIYQLDTGKLTFLTKADVDHEPGNWSPDGSKIVYSANKEGDEQFISDLYVLDVQSQQAEKLTDSTGFFGSGNFSPDGKTIACFGHEKEYLGATLTRLWTIDIETKERICLTKGHDIYITDAMIGDLRSGHPNPGPVWSADGQKLYATASAHGDTNFCSVDLSGEITELFSGKHHVYGYNINVEENLAVLSVSTPTNPGDIYLFDLDTNKATKVTDVNREWLADLHLSSPEEIRFKSTDGWEVQGWVLKPYGFDKANKYPAILEIHGGPHAMYGNTFFHELQLLAAKGYFVLYSNPRGSHGYGQQFVNACRGDYGGKDYQDLMNFVDATVEKYTAVDTERLGVTGGSYGGFMTNWIVSHTNRFKAAATLRSISNWVSFYGVSDIGYFFTEWEIGSDVLQDPEKLWQHSPLKYVNKIETPLLILHGEQDYRCPMEQAEQLFIALKHRGQETRFVRFPNANHELSRSGPPHLRIARLQELVSWFDSYLTS